MGDSAVHDGIFKSNFTAGRRRENNSVAFGKVAVSNELFRECIFSGLIPTPHYNQDRQALRDITRTGSWKRGIPQNIIMKKALAMPLIASTAKMQLHPLYCRA